MAENKVHTSWEAPGNQLCVDLFQRPDGTWGFEEYRREPEDGRGWYPVGFHAQRRFASAEDAARAARSTVPWLATVMPG
ncbi:MAG: hypothetical protein AAGB15_04480 [Pseudomonadota bacterium]